MMEDRTDLIRVINGNAETIHGRFSGTDYKFACGVGVDIPLVVARHIFAFGQEDKTTALNRLGWARTSEEIEKGLEKLGNVVFDDPPEMIEAPKKPRGRKAVAGNVPAAAGPPAVASGTEGGDKASPPDGLGHEDTEAADKGTDEDEF